ncbi:MAG: DUF4012 domain-containing protein [Actinobacteria bacterium]|nr:DUF4012 domain-containing protein [Actinomycetota bacterium]
MRRPRRRGLVLGILGVTVLWLVVVGWLLADARSATESGRQRLEGVRAGATPSSLLAPDTRDQLAAAEADFDHARSRLRSPLLTPLRVLPVAGRHLRAADRVVRNARGSASLAIVAVGELQDLADRPLPAGPARVEALDDLADIVARTRAGLEELDPGDPDALVGPLADAVEALGRERRETLRGLDHAESATRALAGVLTGPTPYLLVGANNAEMRAGSGMFLSAATLGFDQGRLELGEVRPTQELVLPAGSVPVSGDLAANWPWLDAGRDLRNMGLTVDFPQSAELAAANWARVPGGTQVGGVIVVDVDALRALLRVVGPVEVGGVSYTADTVRGELLREQYRRYDDRDARRDQIGEVAKEVFRRIEAGDWDLDQLATALIDSVQRRHLLVWSSDPDVQEAWRTVGADGRLQDRSLAVSLLNRGAEKLDSYLDVHAKLRSSAPDGGGRVRVKLTYTVRNDAPDSGPAYLIGPNIEGMEAGEHRAIVVVNLPAGTTDVVLDGARQTLSGGDGPTVVVAGELSVERGATATVEVTALLPEGLDALVLEPSARVPRTVWDVDGLELELDRRRTLRVGN